MTRILHVSQPTTGGVGRWVEQLARDQVERGWTVGVACPGEGELSSAVVYGGAQHFVWEARRSPGFSVFGEMRRLHSVITTFQPDVVHLHSSKAGLAGRLALRGSVPTLFQPHCWSFVAVGGVVERASRAWEVWSGRWNHRIICVSEAERSIGVESGIDGTRMTVIRNGVDLSVWTPASTTERLQARAALDIANETPVAIAVGRLSRQKGQDRLLDVWPQVQLTVPSATLFLIGDGPQRTELESRVNGMPGVKFVGDRSDIDRWLAAANVVVFPSRWEGLALSVLEASARARSVVATDVAGMREVIGDDRDAGGVVVSNDEARVVNQVAEALIVRLTDVGWADEEGRRGRQRIEDHFTLVRACDETATLVDRVVSDISNVETSEKAHAR